jgi:biotin carboxyl carrier protein
MNIVTIINDEEFVIDLSIDPEREGGYIARIGDREIPLQLAERKPGNMTLSINSKIGYYEFNKEKGRIVEAVHNCRSYSAAAKNPQQDQLEKLLEEFGAGLGGTASETVLKAPMPGKILGLSVKEGEHVELGQVALVLEAMKMENEISSTIEGRVAKLHVQVGDVVNAGDALVEVDPAG